MMFLAELNGLEFWATNIGNAYLESFTDEKVYIVAGPEWGELEGHIMVVNKALNSLRTSGKRWHELSLTNEDYSIYQIIFGLVLSLMFFGIGMLMKKK